MAFFYRGLVDVVLIAADGSEHLESFTATLHETSPDLFEMTTPHKLPAVRGTHSLCVTLDDGRSLGGDVGYVDDDCLSFCRPRVLP